MVAGAVMPALDRHLAAAPVPVIPPRRKGAPVASEGESPAHGRGAAVRPGGRPGFDTSVAHQARMYDYWLGGKDYFAADLRDTGAILEKAAHTLDFTKPVAVTMLAILHAISDEDDPYGIVSRGRDL